MKHGSIDETLKWLGESKQKLILQIIHCEEEDDKSILTDEAARFDHAHSLIQRAYK